MVSFASETKSYTLEAFYRFISLLSRLRLDGGDGDGVDDVFGFAAAREVVAGFVEALQDGADGGAAGQSLGQFVGDVAGLQIGKDQHVGAAGDTLSRALSICRPRQQRGVGLQLAVDVSSGMRARTVLGRLPLLCRSFCAWPIPLVEKESIATRGSTPSRARHESAEAMAISASSAAAGSITTPQSA